MNYPARHQLMHGFDIPRVPQKTYYVPIIYLKPRKQRCDGISPLNALLAPEGHVGVFGWMNFRQSEAKNHLLYREALDRSIRCNTESSHHAEQWKARYQDQPA